MHLENKSNENFNSVGKLIDYNFPNAGASRLYYSVFQAVYSYSIKIGHTPNTKEETKHQRMLRLLTEMTQKDGQYKDMKDLFKVLLGLRVRADYEGDDVRLQELERNYNSAKSLKEHFIGLLYSK